MEGFDPNSGRGDFGGFLNKDTLAYLGSTLTLEQQFEKARLQTLLDDTDDRESLETLAIKHVDLYFLTEESGNAIALMHMTDGQADPPKGRSLERQASYQNFMLQIPKIALPDLKEFIMYLALSTFARKNMTQLFTSTKWGGEMPTDGIRPPSESAD